MDSKYLIQTETMADQKGTGSVWRACLAVQRSCDNPGLGNLVMELGYGHCAGRNVLGHLENIYQDQFPGSIGEFREALKALKNAIELSKKDLF